MTQTVQADCTSNRHTAYNSAKEKEERVAIDAMIQTQSNSQDMASQCGPAGSAAVMAAHSFSVFHNSNPQCIGISHTNRSRIAAKGLLYLIQNTIPKEEYSSTRSIVKFDLI